MKRFQKEFNSDLSSDFPINTVCLKDIEYGTAWVTEKNNENRETLADRDIITIMIVRPHWILKKDIGQIVVKPQTFSDVG